MFTINFYNWKSEISIKAHCDQYAITEEGQIYFLSLVGADSAVRGIIAAIHTGEKIAITGDDGERKSCHNEISLRSFTSKIGYEDLTHGICVESSACEGKGKLILQDNPDSVYAVLHTSYAITAIHEWKDWLYRKLKERGYLEPLQCHGVEALLLQVTEQDLDDMISTGVMSGELKFTKQPGSGNSIIEKIQGVESYLKEFGKELAGKINRNFQPLYMPESKKWHERVSRLLRSPFQAQGDAVMGAVEVLKTQKSVNIVGEMGVGKTLIGAAIPYIYSDTPCRSLIICPGHLVRKWKAEIEKTVPRAKAYIIRKYTDLFPLIDVHKRSVKPTSHEWYIISKDKAKLSYFWRRAVIVRDEKCSCPQCGIVFMDDEGWHVPPSFFEKKKRYCEKCGCALWQADKDRIRRVAPAEFIKQYLKGFFQTLTIDEVHECKSGTTAQGNVFGMLASVVEKVITLTGTLMSGYANDLFFILYRTIPRKMLTEGFVWGDQQKWLERYGILERVTKSRLDAEDNATSRGSKKREHVKRKPGVSPLVYSKFLLGNTVFLQLDDISDNLPLLTEEVIGVGMTPVLEQAYRYLENAIGERVRKELVACGHSALLGAYLLSSLAYPDQPYSFGPIVHPAGKRELPEEYFYLKKEDQLSFLEKLAEQGIFDLSHIVAIPRDVPNGTLYPKEEQLVKIVGEEIKQGRKCFVYCCFTGQRDITPRIRSFLEQQGYKVAVLKSSVQPERRETWLADRVREGYDVIVGNPELVKTGLDLLDFPTLIFFQTGYNTFTLRQSSRRSWRIGQRREVKLYYLFYKGTMQERALGLMGAKLAASMGVEGRFSEEGLAAMSSGDDMMNALAKAIVGKLESLESAEKIWKRMVKTTERITEEAATVVHRPQEQAENVLKVEFIRKNGKRRVVQRTEVRADELDEMLKEKKCMAQLLLF